jgi:hypothetical protein
MDLIEQQIKDQFLKVAAKVGPDVILPATVLNVNDDDTLHVQFSDDSEIDDVRLRSVVKDGNRFVILPAVGSTVQVARIENSDEYVVIAVEDITKSKCVIGSTSFDIDAAGILLQKDNDTLKQALKLLIEAVQAIVVIQGTNPDQVKLQQSFTMIENILK